MGAEGTFLVPVRGNGHDAAFDGEAFATYVERVEGIGAIGAVVVGVVFEGEKINFKKALFLSLIIFSVVMLKIV